ncbi:MAG TPA: helix-turn-helix domain-containing protein, partial [Acidimicrobiales bacterium]|nr:helix-turn-helix domain-containing protein [Acidimicrobiales bacterium]
DFQRSLGISRNILRSRLATLVDAGVLERVPYSEHPPRQEYRLTGKGRDLWPVLTAMRQWGDRYASPAGPRLELTHRGCGAVAEPVFACPVCGEAVAAGDVRTRAGSGLRRSH